MSKLISFTLAAGLAALLAGCAATDRNLADADRFYAQAGASWNDSIYLQHPETHRIVECSPHAVAFPDPFLIAPRLAVADCTKKRMVEGYQIGDHDALKAELKRSPAPRADR